jgi:hypothetical protein
MFTDFVDECRADAISRRGLSTGGVGSHMINQTASITEAIKQVAAAA